MGKILKSILGGTFGIPLISTAVAGADILGSIWSQERANKMNKDINDEKMDFAREQFQYQKYLNNNQFQVQSADAQKAGINPLAMTAGSLNGGSYSNSTNPMEAVYNGGLGSLMAQFASIANQKQISDDRNETDKKIANLNADNSKDIAILKILADKDIADNLNENQKNMLIMKLSSEQKIASGNLEETTRHNKAVEAVQSKIADSQVVLNNSQSSYNDKKIALETVNSQIDNYIKFSGNERDKEKLQNAKKQLEADIKDKNWKHAKIVIDSVLGLLGIAGNVSSSILPGLLKGAFK